MTHDRQSRRHLERDGFVASLDFALHFHDDLASRSLSQDIGESKRIDVVLAIDRDDYVPLHEPGLVCRRVLLDRLDRLHAHHDAKLPPRQACSARFGRGVFRVTTRDVKVQSFVWKLRQELAQAGA